LRISCVISVSVLLVFRGDICNLRRYVKLSFGPHSSPTHSLNTPTQTDYLQSLKYKFTARVVVSWVSVNCCR